MAVMETKLEYVKLDFCENGEVAAIIVCGGSSSRMKGVDKMFLPVLSVPVAIRSILKFEKCESISKIVVVTKEDKILQMQQLVEQFGIKKVTDITVGGKCRQESVANGMKCLDENVSIVLVHDGARPFVNTKSIDSVVLGAKKYSAAACAVPVKDTVKQVKKDGLVVTTPERSSLMAVQTPQGFSLELYKRAIAKFADRLEDFTDDCSVVEAYGSPVYLVEGDYSNIKITTEDDVLLAEAIAMKEEQND